MIQRIAGRGVVVAATGRVLMIHGEDPDDPARGGFWFTPGGGLDQGESLEDGTRRELYEELALEDVALGPTVMQRVDEFSLAGEWYRQTETLFLVVVDDEFDPVPVHLEALELSVIDEFRWLSADELRALTEPYYPLSLAELLDEIRTAGPPDPPWTEDLSASGP